MPACSALVHTVQTHRLGPCAAAAYARPFSPADKQVNKSDVLQAAPVLGAPNSIQGVYTLATQAHIVPSICGIRYNTWHGTQGGYACLMWVGLHTTLSSTQPCHSMYCSSECEARHACMLRVHAPCPTGNRASWAMYLPCMQDIAPTQSNAVKSASALNAVRHPGIDSKATDVHADNFWQEK